MLTLKQYYIREQVSARLTFKPRSLQHVDWVPYHGHVPYRKESLRALGGDVSHPGTLSSSHDNSLEFHSLGLVCREIIMLQYWLGVKTGFPCMLFREQNHGQKCLCAFSFNSFSARLSRISRMPRTNL